MPTATRRSVSSPFPTVVSSIVGGSFRILPHRVKLDALVGYRGIKFDFDYDIDGGETRLNIKLAGPYAGLRVSF